MGVKNSEKSRRRTKPPTFMIESSGGVLKEEFTDVEPAEFKVKSRKERKKEQEEAWIDFNKELAELIHCGKFSVDPETKEVRKVGQAESKRKG